MNFRGKGSFELIPAEVVGHFVPAGVSAGLRVDFIADGVPALSCDGGAEQANSQWILHRLLLLLLLLLEWLRCVCSGLVRVLCVCCDGYLLSKWCVS